MLAFFLLQIPKTGEDGGDEDEGEKCTICISEFEENEDVR
jgi:hypothetical protein